MPSMLLILIYAIAIDANADTVTDDFAIYNYAAIDNYYDVDIDILMLW